MSLATTSSALTFRAIGQSPLKGCLKSPLRAAGAVALLFATCLPAAAAVQGSGRGAPIVAVEKGYQIDFEQGVARRKVSLHEFATAAANAMGQVLLWDEATEERLKAKHMRHTVPKVVPTARFMAYLKTTMLAGDFVCIQLGEGDAGAIQVIPITASGASELDSQGDALIRLEGDQYALDFGEMEAGKEISLYEFIQSSASVTGMQFTWADTTEAVLKEWHVRLRGKKVVPKEHFMSFFTAMMAISDFVCTEVGSGDISVILIERTPTTKVDDESSDASVVSDDEQVVLTFGSRREAAKDMSVYELIQTLQATTETQYTWSAPVEVLLKERRIRLTGKKSIPKDQFVPFLRVLLATSDFGCEVFGEGDVSVIKIDSL